MKDLVPSTGAKTVRLYEKMQSAIGKCFSFDDCKAIADQAAAIAAYHKQIKDDASMRQFLEIKLRAWRRIGEIFGTVDTSGCESFAARARKIRTALAIEEMSDDHIRQAIGIASLPLDFFEEKVGGVSNILSVLSAYERLRREQWAASPKGREEAKRQAEQLAVWEAQHAAKDAKQRKKVEEEQKLAEEEARLLYTLKTAHTEAVREDCKDMSLAAQGLRNADAVGVGITLDRRDRMKMHTTVFLLREPIHEALRKAAFEQRMTMHAVLREGLAMWFVANGYSVPMSDTDLRPRTTKARNGVATPEVKEPV